MLERAFGNPSGTTVGVGIVGIGVIVGEVTTGEFVWFATHVLNSGNKASVNIGSGTTNLKKKY